MRLGIARHKVASTVQTAILIAPLAPARTGLLTRALAGLRSQLATDHVTNPPVNTAKPPMQPALVAVSDDLTGAVALAGEARRRGGDVQVVAWDRVAPRPAATRALVVDTCSRLLEDEAAARRIRDVLAIVAETEATMYKRVDSYLRGPVSAELDAWVSVLRAPLLVALAAPAFGIRTLEGVQWAGRQRVTDAFGEGAADAPRSAVIADLIPGSTRVDLDAVRSADLAATLTSVLARGHAVCDGETASDLYRLARAAADAADRGASFSLVGSYGLADAWLRARDSGRPSADSGVLVSSDSMKEATLDQLAAFAESGGSLVTFDPGGDPPADDQVAAWAALLRAGGALALSSVDPQLPSPASTPAAARALAAVTARLVERARPAGLILIGGELASSLMQVAGCVHLDILAEPWPTSPVARFCGGALDGTLGILKSGSRGDSQWLVHAVSLLAHLNAMQAKRAPR